MPRDIIALVLCTVAFAKLHEKQCASNCELLGVCGTDGLCKCHPGFAGASCGQLDFAPSDPQTARQWPAENATGVSAWGFTAVHDPADGLYHAIVGTGCGDNSPGVLASGCANCMLSHLKSSHPDRGWTLAGAFAPPNSFGPHLSVAPDGTFVLIFRVNAMPVDALFCPANASGTFPGLANLTCVRQPEIHAGDPEKGQNMFVAWAAKMSGPWQVQQVNVSGEGSQHISNPSLMYIRSGTPAASRGRVGMAFRYNSQHGEKNGFAFAPDFRGPYVSAGGGANTTISGEDPFAWQALDGSLHMLYHNGPHGYHAYSADGREWAAGSGHAFELSVEYTDGSSQTFHRRERPELSFHADGAPAFFYSAVQASGEVKNAFSHVQPLRAKSAMYTV